MREHYRVDGKDYTFEEKMESDYLPRVRASGRAPHYIILGQCARIAHLPILCQTRRFKLT